MRDHPVGMGELPGREGVGGKALVDQREARNVALVLQVAVIFAELGHQNHALVDDGPGRERDRVIGLHLRVVEAVDLGRDDLARGEEAPLESVLVRDRGRAPDEDLTVERLGLLDADPEVLGVHGHVAPAELRQTLVGENLCDDILDDLASFLVLGQEEHADAVMARLGQGETEGLAFSLEKGVRDLGENAAAVAHLRIGADRTAMVEILKDE